MARLKLVLAMMMHETNTFSPVPTPLASFRPLQGEAAIAEFKDTNTQLGGFLDVAQRAGAEIVLPVAVSFADALPQLRSGQLDAVLSSGDGGAGERLMETLRHFTAIEYAVTMSMVTINADAWRALDPARQQAVREAAEETEARQWEVMKTRVAANYARMRAAGVTLTTELSSDYRRALRGAGQVAVDDWLRQMGPAGARILDAYRARLAGR